MEFIFFFQLRKLALSLAIGGTSSKNSGFTSFAMEVVFRFAELLSLAPEEKEEPCPSPIES